MTEFSNKILTRSGLDYLLKKIDIRASVKRLSGSGRPRTACTSDNVDVVEELVMSHENQHKHTVPYDILLAKLVFTGHLLISKRNVVKI